MVGSGVGAKGGVLFKTAVALEAAGKSDIVVLDKTGTVTEGRPQVTDVAADREEELLLVALALEMKSEHPLSRAVVHYGEKLGKSAAAADNFAALPGHGVFGTVNGEEAYGGNAELMLQKGLLTADMKKKGESFAREGKTPLYFACGGKLLPITWTCDGEDQPFRFFTEAGEPLLLGRGNTYIAVASADSIVTWEPGIPVAEESVPEETAEETADSSNK